MVTYFFTFSTPLTRNDVIGCINCSLASTTDCRLPMFCNTCEEKEKEEEDEEEWEEEKEENEEEEKEEEKEEEEKEEEEEEESDCN